MFATAAGAATFPGLPAHAASPQVLRIGMTAADLPTTHGIPNNGGEGFRFLGYPAYDSVVNWDFTHTDKLADIKPGCSLPGGSTRAIRFGGSATSGRGSSSTTVRTSAPMQ